MAPLTSRLFAGDELLQSIADDVNRVRISFTQNSSGPSVGKVQRALLLWDANALPEHGPDESYGNETARAVHRFKVEELGVPEDEVIDDVGPRTVQRLDEIAFAHEQEPGPEDGDPVPPELRAAVEAMGPALLALPGVTGYGTGYRMEGDEVVEEVTVHVFVRDESSVPPGLPLEIGGVGVSVTVLDPIPCVADEARYPQLKGGIRIERTSMSGFGTMGAVVQDPQTKELLGLTCQHVVGNPGGTFPDVVWQPLVSPSVRIPGSKIDDSDAVGATVNSASPLSGADDVDAAVFRLDLALNHKDRSFKRTTSAAIVDQVSLGPDMIAAVKAIAEPRTGMPVRKRGFVTLRTTGIVLTDVNSEWNTRTGKGRIVKQWVIAGSTSNPGGLFCDTGDSGSLVLDDGDPKTAVGLLWGQNLGGRHGIMSAISAVQTRLGIKVAWS